MFFAAFFVALAGLLTSIKPRRVRRRLRRRKLWRRRRPNIHRRSRPQQMQPSGLHGYGDVPEDRRPDTDGPIQRELSSLEKVQEEESSSSIDATIGSTGDDGTPQVTPNCSLGENASDSMAEPHDIPPTLNTQNTSYGSLSKRELSSRENVQEEESSSNIDGTIGSTGDDGTPQVTPNFSLGKKQSFAEQRDIPPALNTQNTSYGSLSKPSVENECAQTSCQTQDSGFSDCGCSDVSTSEDCCTGTDNCNKSGIDNCSGTRDDGDRAMFLKESHHRLESRGVTLERVELTQDGSAVIGTILVRNECYEKHVAVRHTANDWQTFHDTSAQWIETLEGGAVDRFQFRLEFRDEDFSMEFAVSFNGKWDNNEGKNYSLSCKIFNV